MSTTSRIRNKPSGPAVSGETTQTTWVSAAQLARRYNVTSQAISRWAHEGKLPSIKFGGTRRFDFEKCTAMIEGRTSA